MSKKHVFIAIFTFLFTSCAKSEQGDPVVLPEENIDPPVVVDVYALDYWEKAVLVWGDDFDGAAISTDNWSFETGANGWGNNELQNYVANDNAEVSNGTLKIIAKLNDDPQIPGRYTSTRLNSKQAFKHGRMEIRAKIPDHKGNGIWPAIWMLGNNIQTAGWPACGEIDIMEYVSFDPNKTHFSIHSTANNHLNGTQITSGPILLETIEEEFHNYGVLWTDKYLRFYIDDIDNVKLTFTRPTISNIDSWPFSNPFYFLLNIAVGGNWGGLQGVDDSIFPAIMEVDYVRVYQVK